MAHEIDMSNGRANFAYVGQPGWHGLGYQIREGASIEEWKKEAGMDFKLMTYPAMYYNPVLNAMQVVPDRRIIVRGDTHVPLSVVSNNFKLVQTGDVLEFFRDLVADAGFIIDTAGVLKGGRKFWALARIGKETMIAGVDKIEAYLLLATSCDMSLATVGMLTSIRVVCANTLAFAMEGPDSGRKVKVSHNMEFDAARMKAQLGFASKSWDTFIHKTRELTQRKVTDKEAINWVARVLGDAEKAVEDQSESVGRSMLRVIELYNGGAKGSNMVTAKGTAWGLVNAVTEFQDHQRAAQSVENRLDRTWFGDGALVKNRAWDEAVALLV